MLHCMRMFKTMITGLFAYRKFADKESFWDWYWNEQIPDARYSGECLYESWIAFKWFVTGGWLKMIGKRGW